MFTVLKVRDDQKRGDYADPDWYAHPAGSVAREWTGDAPEATSAAPAPNADNALQVRKPGDATGGHEHH